MKYAIEFDIPDNETTRKSIKTDRVQWRFLGYGGYCMAQPVIHAHWEIIYESSAGVTDAKCSNCGFESLAYENDVHTDENCNYCPCCGAKMDEVVNDG